MAEEYSLIFDSFLKTNYWRGNEGFTFSPEVKVYLLNDSSKACMMQSTETTLAGISYTDNTTS